MQLLSQQLLIHELAELAQVSIRTIRYYIAEGLLPTPETRGKYTSYSQDYVERIRLIQRLKDAYLPLREIRALMENIPFEDTHRMLERTRHLSPEDFVKVVREHSNLNSPHNHVNEDVVTYTSKLLRQPNPRSQAPQMDRSINLGMIDDEELVHLNMDQPLKLQLEDPSIMQKNPHLSLEENQYYRLTITPGLDLHVDRVVYAKFRRQIDRLIEFATRLFAKT